MNAILRVAMALATVLWQTPAMAADVRQEIDVRVQQRFQKTQGARSPIPEEYGEKPDGLILERYKLDYETENYLMDVEASNIGKNNQSLRMEGGQPGKLTWKGGWDEMPHLFSYEARSPFSYQGGGYMALNGGWRNTALTSANNGFNAGVSTALAGAPYTPLGFTVETGNLDLRFHPAQDFTVELGGWQQARRGTRSQAAAFGFSNAIELAAPIDQTANEAYLDMQLAKKDVQLGFNYRLSEFKNKIPQLFWDNPKRMTDQYTSSSHYSAGDGGSKGAMAMAPDNTAHSLKVEGGVNLPLQTRLSFETGYQIWRALNPMMPYTLNTQMNSGNATAAAAGLTFDAANPANRPDKDVDGRIDVLTGLLKLSARPLSWLRGSLSHEIYDLQNHSKQYTLPGWAVFDQVWHSEAGAQTPREELREGKTSLKLDYDMNSWLSGNTGVSYKTKKVTREIPRSREYEGTTGLTVRPGRALSMNLSYLLNLRRGQEMDFEHYPKATDTGGRVWFTEAPGMRRPDVADRNRNQARAQLQWLPGESSVSLSARVTEDKFRPGKGSLNGDDPLVYPELFGTISDLQEAVGLDLSVPLLKSLGADAYYEFDYSKRILRSNQTQAANTCGGTGGTYIMCQNPIYRWETRLTENSHIAGLALTWLPAESLKTVLSYDLVSTRFNGDPVSNGSSITNYRPYETSRRMLQTLRARNEFKLNKALTLSALYEYEKFDATDFAYGDVPLRNMADAIWLGANPIRNYYAHTASLGLNYKF